MRAYLITMFCLGLISVLFRLWWLGTRTYPRVVTNSRGEDAASLLISLGFLVWVGYLVFVGS